jgi:pimeloyl-ACP methyl ester carboxylesterase
MAVFHALVSMAIAMSPSQPVHGPGVHDLSAQVMGREVRYTLVLPAEPKGAPVLLALHYAGHGEAHYAHGFVTAMGLEGAGAVVIAPDCPGSSWSEEQTVKLVLGLLDQLSGELGLKSKPALIGYSMGGIGAWTFATEHPERFRALVPVAGRPGTVLPKVPVFAIHGGRDAVIEVGPTRAAIATLRGQGADATLVVLPEATHYEVGAFQPAVRDALTWLAAH